MNAMMLTFGTAASLLFAYQVNGPETMMAPCCLLPAHWAMHVPAVDGQRRCAAWMHALFGAANKGSRGNNNK